MKHNEIAIYSTAFARDFIDYLVKNNHTSHLDSFMAQFIIGSLSNYWGGRDRSGLIEKDNPIKFNYTPIPENVHTDMTLREVSLERAQWYWDNKPSDEPLYLMWSGGIDSTLAATALMETNSNWDKDMIFILAESSITEYEWFFKKYLEPKPHCYEIVDGAFLFDDGLFSKGKYVISGKPADQLFGGWMFNRVYAWEPWTDIFDESKPGLRLRFNQPRLGGGGRGGVHDEGTDYEPPIDRYDSGAIRYSNDVIESMYISANTRGEYINDLCLDYINTLVSKCPIKVERVFDFYWWMTFCFTWDGADRKIAMKFDDPLLYKNMSGFYNSDNFQRWGISHHYESIKDTWESYKYPLKEAIYEYTKDKDYLDNKEKEPSLPLAVPGQTLKEILSQTKYKMIDTNDNVFHMERIPEGVFKSVMRL